MSDSVTQFSCLINGYAATVLCSLRGYFRWSVKQKIYGTVRLGETFTHAPRTIREPT